MADPLAVTSLGITICSGLLKAIDAWRSYGDDIKEARSQMDALAKTLNIIRDIIQEPGPATRTKNLVEDSVKDCEDAIVKLQQEVKKLQGQLPTGEKRAGQKFLQQIAYPIVKTTLAKIRNLVGEVQQRLGLALQSLQRYVWNVHSPFFSELLFILCSADSKALMNDLSDLSLAVNRTLKTTSLVQTQVQQEIPSTIRMNHAEVLSRGEQIYEDIRKLPQEITPLIEATGHRTIARMAETIAIMKDEVISSNTSNTQNISIEMANAISSAVVKKVAEEHRTFTSLFQMPRFYSPNDSVMLPPPSLQRDMINTFANSNASLSCPSAVGAHGKQFRHSERRRRGQKVSERRFTLWLFSRSIHVKFGAGGSSIAAEIRLGGVYNPSSPAFYLFSKQNNYKEIPQEARAGQLPYLLKVRMRKLRDIYRNNQASPRDIDCYGQTMFHVGTITLSPKISN